MHIYIYENIFFENDLTFVLFFNITPCMYKVHSDYLLPDPVSPINSPILYKFFSFICIYVLGPIISPV